MTLLKALTGFIIASEKATTDGVDIFRDYTPEDPDHIVVLNEYAGDSDAPHDDAVHRSVQILVRDNSPVVAKQKATDIYKLLKTDNRIVHFNSEWWGQVYLRQTPFKVRTDANDRVLYGFNAGITTRID